MFLSISKKLGDLTFGITLVCGTILRLFYLYTMLKPTLQFDTYHCCCSHFYKITKWKCSNNSGVFTLCYFNVLKDLFIF